MSRLHTMAEVAEMFGDGTTERNVRDWVRQYGWPHIKVGRTVRFTEEQLTDIFARHTMIGERPAAGPAVVIEGQTKRSAARSRGLQA